jgi:hypothetical protein
MKKVTMQFLTVCMLLAASLFYVSAQTRGTANPTPAPKPRTNACCNQTSSGGLTGCNKPYKPAGGGASCPGNMVKAKCDARYNNCTKEDW